MSEKTTGVTSPLYTYTVLKKSQRFLDWESSQGPRYAEYRRQWMENTARRVYGDFPLCLSIEVTTRCNMACTFCYHRLLEAHEKYDMGWALYQKIIDEGARYELPSINLNGLGESTLHRDLPRMAKYASDNGVIDIMFHTNGMVMSDRVMRALIESGLHQIVFSIDSPDKATYESIRIHGRYDSVIENVHRLVRMREAMGSLTPIIRVTMVVTKRTAHQVPKFRELWEPVVDLVTLQDLLYSVKEEPEGDGSDSWMSPEESVFDVSPPRVRAAALARGESFVCSYPYQRLMIHVDGVVTLCAQREAKTHLVLGNVKEDSLHDLWVSHMEQEIRALHDQGRWYENPACRTCDIALLELHKRQSG